MRWHWGVNGQGVWQNQAELGAREVSGVLMRLDRLVDGEACFTYRSYQALWQLTLGFCLMALTGCGSDSASETTGTGQSGGAAPQTIALKAALTPGQIAQENAEARETLRLLVSPKALAAASQPTTYPFNVTVTYNKPGLNYGITGQDPAISGFIVNSFFRIPTPDPIPPNVNGYPIPVIFQPQSFNFNGSAPNFGAFEEVNLNPQLTDTVNQPGSTPLVDGGVILKITNAQTGDSFTVGGSKPTGANITYAYDTIHTFNGTVVRHNYLGTARFADGWRVSFHSDDSLLGRDPSLAEHGQKSEVNLVFGPPSSAVVTINSFSASPSTFSPSSGETTNFQAGIIASGFGSNATLNWTLTPATTATLQRTAAATGGGGGLAVAPSFSGTSDISSGVANITQNWNGRSATGQNLPFGDYPYSLNVTVVDSNGLSNTAAANTTATLSDSAELEVSETSSGNDRGAAFSPDTEETDSTVVAPLLRQIFPANENYTIRGIGLRFTGPQPDTITARVTSNVSHKQVLKPLTFDRTKNAFVGSFAYSEVIQQQPVPTLYSSVVGILNPDDDSHFQEVADRWESLIAASDTNNVYKGPKAKVGQLQATLTSPDIELTDLLDPERAPSINGVKDPVTGLSDDSSNLFHYGFESVNVTLEGEGLVNTDLRAMIRVAHPANVFFLTLHGGHSGYLETNPSRDLATVPPQPPIESAPGQVLFLTCSALDLRDYNNFYALSHFPPQLVETGHPASAGLNESSIIDATTGQTYNYFPRNRFGGESWFQAFSGQTTLLGYDGVATGLISEEVATTYERHLSLGESAIMAWLRANREVAASGQVGISWLALNACAYDTNGDYYYIAYAVPEGAYVPEIPSVKAGQIEVFGIYKVPASAWNLEADSWDDVPQRVKGQTLASKVE